MNNNNALVKIKNDERVTIADLEIVSRSGNQKYCDSYTIQERTGKITDADIYEYVKKHTY